MASEDRSHVTPKVRAMALAYRIWGYCKPRDWNVTYREVADALGVHQNAVASVARRQGWQNAFRTQRLDVAGIAARMGGAQIKVVDEMFDGLDDGALLEGVL